MNPKLEAVLQWCEDALRSIPLVTRIILISFLAGTLGILAMNASYLLAGGR